MSKRKTYRLRVPKEIEDEVLKVLRKRGMDGDTLAQKLTELFLLIDAAEEKGGCLMIKKDAEAEPVELYFK